MKNSIKKSTDNKSIANFQNVVLEEKALKQVKGGGDFIGTVDIIGG